VRADDFARNYLLSPEFVNFILENDCLVWASTVRSSEGYKVCSALQDFNFPFIALLCMNQGQTTCILRRSGEFTLHSLIDELQNSSAAGRTMLDSAHAERAQREMDTQLRREQESDYERSLATDRAKVTERKRLESEKLENEKKIEELRQQEEQALNELETRSAKIQASLPSEPASDENNIVRVVIRFPDGSRTERRFNADDSLEALFNVAFTNQNCPKFFSLMSGYPRQVIRCAPEWYRSFSELDIFPEGPIPTFRDAGLEGSVAVLVQDTDA